MPKPKAYRPLPGFDIREPREPKETKPSPSLSPPSPPKPIAESLAESVEQSDKKLAAKPSPLSDPANRNPGRVNVSLPSRDDHGKQSLDKHGQSLRYKAAYAADLLAEDIISVFRRSGKKDKEYLKGLVWSFGVLFDKATGGVSQDAVNVRIPAKLLENVNAVIAIQVSKHASKPAKQDIQSSQHIIESTACEALVAPDVAPDAADTTTPSA